MPRQLVRLALALGSIALILIASLLLARTSGIDLDPATPPAAPAPDFTLTTLDGDQLRLAELRGKAVVVNFWGSWCAPCRTGMPYFEQAHRANRDRGVVFVGAAVEDRFESAHAFAREFGITYPVGLDDGSEIAKSYGLRGLPGTIFIRRDGTFHRRWPGLISEEQLAQLIDEIAR